MESPVEIGIKNTGAGEHIDFLVVESQLQIHTIKSGSGTLVLVLRLDRLYTFSRDTVMQDHV